MPYKDKKQDKEASKERMRRYRQKGVTSAGVTDEGVTPDGTHFIDGVENIPASYVEGKDGRRYESLPIRPRYLELSDGQVLDRLNQPIANTVRVETMRACNESSYNYHPKKGEISVELRARFT